MPSDFRQVLESAFIVAAADDVELRVERRIERSGRLEQHVDVLLAGHPADEDDAVLGARLEVGV